MNCKTFEEQYNFIADNEVQEFTITMLKNLPDYFYIIPASSSGKYHPKYALGKSGLVRHVKAAIGIAIELFEIYDFSQIEKDCILSALLLHDGLKKGLKEHKHTLHEHPILIADFIINNQEKYELNTETRDIIIACVKSHMGKWTTNPYSQIILPKPKAKITKFVHLCDYLASRKCLEYVGKEELNSSI